MPRLRLLCLFVSRVCVPQKGLVFQDIELKLPSSGKVLLNKVTGKATAGRVLALMGPSGERDKLLYLSWYLS